MFKTPIGRLRAIGMTEAASFLLLLGVAMPMKYLLGMPLAVRIVGMLHGVLFIAFCVALVMAWRDRKWEYDRPIGLFVAAFIPFGPFLMDRGLKREQAESAKAVPEAA
jgi:integral membrane protein